jgi:hypothetical protein
LNAFAVNGKSSGIEGKDQSLRLERGGAPAKIFKRLIRQDLENDPARVSPLPQQSGNGGKIDFARTNRIVSPLPLRAVGQMNDAETRLQDFQPRNGSSPIATALATS